MSYLTRLSIGNCISVVKGEELLNLLGMRGAM